MKKSRLIQSALDFRNGLLDGKESDMMCFVVSSSLAGYLHYENIDCKLVEGSVVALNIECNHFWIEMPDGNILDPTADQFIDLDGNRMPKVYYGILPNFYQKGE